jgi:hypothetical protein
MADKDTAKNGVYFDTKTNKVVEKQPEEGIQLVAPGGEVTGHVKARIDQFKAIEAGEPGAAPTATMTVEPKSDPKAKKG